MQRKRKDYDLTRLSQPGDERWYLLIRQSSNHPFRPPTDVIELSDRLVVLVEIAGVRTNDLSITLLERHLVITGLRDMPQFENPAYHQVEIGFGEFRIEVTLPWPVNRDEVSASYEAGFLQIELPRKAARQIPIVDVNNVE
jgi:HSP20 family protein